MLPPPPQAAGGTWLEECAERAAEGRRRGGALGEARDRVECAEPGRERGVVHSLRSREWQELWEGWRGRRGTGEGGGCRTPSTGAKSTLVILRALAGLVYRAGLNWSPLASFSRRRWERTSGLVATR